MRSARARPQAHVLSGDPGWPSAGALFAALLVSLYPTYAVRKRVSPCNVRHFSFVSWSDREQSIGQYFAESRLKTLDLLLQRAHMRDCDVILFRPTVLLAATVLDLALTKPGHRSSADGIET